MVIKGSCAGFPQVWLFHFDIQWGMSYSSLSSKHQWTFIISEKFFRGRRILTFWQNFRVNVYSNVDAYEFLQSTLDALISGDMRFLIHILLSANYSCRKIPCKTVFLIICPWVNVRHLYFIHPHPLSLSL